MLSKKKEYSITIICPYCKRDKLLADESVDVNLSVHCANCGNYYKANLVTGRAEKMRAVPVKVKL